MNTKETPVKRSDPNDSREPSRALSKVLRGASTVAVIASAVALAACGGSGSTSSSTGANGSAGASNKGSSQETSRLKFTQCMREHGVPISDAEKVPALQSAPQATLKAALAACQKYAAGSFGQAASPSGQAHLMDQLVKYASCLRENGVNIADPTEASIAGAASFANSLGKVRQNPNFPQANSKCQKNLPSASERGGP
jgi:hypothetical protein